MAPVGPTRRRRRLEGLLRRRLPVQRQAGVRRADGLGSPRGVSALSSNQTEGAPLSILFAAAYPERVTSLILYGSYARRIADDDYPWGTPRDRLEGFQRSFDEAWATGRWWDIVNPDAVDDPPTQEAWARYLRV